MVSEKLNWMVLLLLVMLLGSCSTKTNVTDVPYFQNSREYKSVMPGEGLTEEQMTGTLIIRPKDQINVFVHSKDENAIANLNLRERRAMTPGKSAYENVQSGFYNYLVDNDGNITYPMIGKVHVLGLTVEEAAKVIREGLTTYFHDDPSLTINVRIANFYVSVLGEVRAPKTFDVTRPRITVLEALAKAGDLTVYGKRDNVKVLRLMDNGEYGVHELDLRDANILNSPYYYLQQRDIVYVEPNEVQAVNTKVGQTTRLWVRGAAITISLGSLLYRVLQ
jgi:polysaccharide export outer membrane protein